MNHINRLIKSAFTSPETSTRLEFKYRDSIPYSFDKRLDAYTYARVNGTEYRDLGFGGATYPFNCVFDSDNHDQESSNFVKLLKETASPGYPGYLEHPREGVVEVVVKSVTVNHNPAKDGAQTVVEVIFWKQLTLPEQFKKSPSIAVKYALDDFNNASQNDFSISSLNHNISQRLSTIRETKTVLSKISDNVSTVLSTNANIISTFDQINTDILNNIDTIVKSPLVLASQLQQMTGLIFGTSSRFKERVNAWIGLYSDVIGDDEKPDLYYNDTNVITKNKIAMQELVAGSAIANNITNVVLQSDSFKTKQEAFDALQQSSQMVLNLGADLDSISKNFDSNNFQDQYFSQTDSYKKLKSLVEIATASIQNITTDLKTTVQITTSIDCTILDIASKYYDNVNDDILNFIIDSNSLSLDDILYIKAGTTLQI